MARYRRFFESRFDRLEDHLKEMVADQDVAPTSPPRRSKAIEKPAEKAPARRKTDKENTARTQQPRRK
jgi:hypothetical protein